MISTGIVSRLDVTYVTRCLGLSFRLRLELVSSRSFVAELPPLLGRLANLAALLSQKGGGGGALPLPPPPPPSSIAIVLVPMFFLGVLFRDFTSLG